MSVNMDFLFHIHTLQWNAAARNLVLPPPVLTQRGKKGSIMYGFLTPMVYYLLHTALGDGSHCTDVDLGTLGRRPFAIREDGSTGSKTGEIEEVDQGETGSGDTSRANTREKLERFKSQRSAQKKHLWSSFLTPVFNRHDSFTPSIVKPSQSDLHQKAAQKSVRRKLGTSERAIHQVAFTSEESQQEEIKIPEGLSGGVSGRETLLEDTVGVDKLSWTRRVLKRVGLSIKCSLYDLRHFLW